MRLVVDANLPPDIADWLGSRGHDAVAVRDLGLRESPDGPVRDAALARGAIVILKRRAQLEHLDKVWLSVLNRLATDAPIVEVW